MTEEKKLDVKVANYFKDMKPYIVGIRKEQGKFSQRRGVLDWLVCCNGQFIAIELKVGKNKPTEHQKDFADDIVKAGGRAFCCWSIEEVKHAINLCLHGSPGGRELWV